MQAQRSHTPKPPQRDDILGLGGSITLLWPRTEGKFGQLGIPWRHIVVTHRNIRFQVQIQT